MSWPDEAVTLLQTGQVTEISLDHDQSDDARGAGYDVLFWIEDAVHLRGFLPPSNRFGLMPHQCWLTHDLLEHNHGHNPHMGLLALLRTGLIYLDVHGVRSYVFDVRTGQFVA